MYEFIMISWAIGWVIRMLLRDRLEEGKLRDAFFIAWKVCTAGFLLNLSVMALNGLKMPVRGMITSQDWIHIPMTDKTIGAIFADYFIVGNATFSIGDIMLVCGSIVIISISFTWLISHNISRKQKIKVVKY